jgi:hypothetical protein
VMHDENAGLQGITSTGTQEMIKYFDTTPEVHLNAVSMCSFCLLSCALASY